MFNWQILLERGGSGREGAAEEAEAKAEAIA
jgi:hypothetical protein